MLENIDLSQTFNIPIMGEGNTGKSSLMNALLQLSRREALQVSKVGEEFYTTKNIIPYKIKEKVYLIDTPALSYLNYLNFFYCKLIIFIVTGLPRKSDRELINRVKKRCDNLWIVLNQIDHLELYGSEYINSKANHWKNLLKIDHIYLTSTRGYDPKSTIPFMNIRGVKALREDIYNFIEKKTFVKSIEIIENKADLSKKKINDNISIKSVLESYQQTAIKSYDINFKYSQELATILASFKNNISKKNYNNFNGKNIEITKLFNDITQLIDNILTQDLEQLNSSLAIKKKHIKDYTIVLFGRTKAGKSTIREALTNGDGSTIGKGGQRTTKEVHEYRWNHLRLIDTPGIEANEGEEDTNKATKKVAEADMVLFLTSDDSVQPGEFEEMARLSQINKPFIVLLNVKAKLESEAQLKRFLTKPEKTFDEERLSGHHHHIQKYFSQHLYINQVQIIDIQARAGFLSNLSEYEQYKSELWKLSRLDQVYSVIAEDIYNYGNKRRASTFFDGTKVLIKDIEKKLSVIKTDIDSQLKFLQIKEKEVKNLFSDYMKDTDQKIDSEIKVIFSQFKQEVPTFVDHAVGNRNADEEWKAKQNRLENKLEESIKIILKMVMAELKEKLSEFEQEYSYDAKNINFNVNFDNFYKGGFGNVLKGLGLILGAIGAGVFIFNPVIGVGFAIGNMIVNFFSDKVKDNEKRKFNQQKENTKNDILTKVAKQEQELITKLKREVKSKLKEIKKDILSPSEFSNKELSFINQQILISEKEIKEVLNKLQNDHTLIQLSSDN